MTRLAIVGTPDEVVPQIAALAAAGVTQLNIGPPLGPHPAQAIYRTGRDVIPRLRRSGEALGTARP
jgi:alkanesulfonate monooxygenase SsuD/methylene tetrahydromethanopterin reductase-like flavin-dependent oxidoreductase (luciferase family)